MPVDVQRVRIFAAKHRFLGDLRHLDVLALARLVGLQVSFDRAVLLEEITADHDVVKRQDPTDGARQQAYNREQTSDDRLLRVQLFLQRQRGNQPNQQRREK